MAAAYGRVVARAPTDASCSHRGATRSGHVAAALGRGLRYVGHRRCRHRGFVGRGAKAHLAAIACTLAVLRVGTHIIDGACRQACHIASVSACARATRRMAACDGRVVARTPADAALRYRGAAIGGHVARTFCAGLGNICHLPCRHRGRTDVL